MGQSTIESIGLRGGDFNTLTPSRSIDSSRCLVVGTALGLSMANYSLRRNWRVEEAGTVGLPREVM